MDSAVAKEMSRIADRDGSEQSADDTVFSDALFPGSESFGMVFII